MLLAFALLAMQERVRFLEYPPDRPVAARVGRTRVGIRYPPNGLVWGSGAGRPYVRWGLRPQTPPAVDRALKWLADRQSSDGLFAEDEEITGVCLMAFLAAGHTPWDARSPFRRLLRRGFAPLLTRPRLRPTAELAVGLALECTGSTLFDHVPWTHATSPGGEEWRAWTWSTVRPGPTPEERPADPLGRLYWIERAYRHHAAQTPGWRTAFEDAMRDTADSQAPDGSWGDLRTTAINVLALCTERRFLPAFAPVGPRRGGPSPAFP